MHQRLPPKPGCAPQTRRASSPPPVDPHRRRSREPGVEDVNAAHTARPAHGSQQRRVVVEPQPLAEPVHRGGAFRSRRGRCRRRRGRSRSCSRRRCRRHLCVVDSKGRRPARQLLAAAASRATPPARPVTYDVSVPPYGHTPNARELCCDWLGFSRLAIGPGMRRVAPPSHVPTMCQLRFPRLGLDR